MSKRSIVLGLIASFLLCVYLFEDQITLPSPPNPGMTTDAVVQRIERLQRFQLARQEIENRYIDIALSYAEMMAGLGTFKDRDGLDGVFVESLVRERISALDPIDELNIEVGEPQRFAEGVRRVVMTLSFTTESDRDALLAISTLGIPDQGLSWERFSLSADRRERKVRVAGQLASLIVEPAE